MEEIVLHHNFSLNEQINFINDSVVRMSLVLEDYRDEILKRLNESEELILDSLVSVIRNEQVVYFIPPQMFSTNYTNGHVWLNQNNQYTAIKINELDDSSLYIYLESVFKDKPTSGYFVLGNMKMEFTLLSYLPFHYRHAEDIKFDIYNLCCDEMMKLNYRNY